MRYQVCGVDEKGYTELMSYDSLAEAVDYVKNYTRRLDDDGRAGGWAQIDVCDTTKSEDPAFCMVHCWEAPRDDPFEYYEPPEVYDDGLEEEEAEEEEEEEGDD